MKTEMAMNGFEEGAELEAVMIRVMYALGWLPPGEVEKLRIEAQIHCDNLKAETVKVAALEKELAGKTEAIRGRDEMLVKASGDVDRLEKELYVKNAQATHWRLQARAGDDLFKEMKAEIAALEKELAAAKDVVIEEKRKADINFHGAGIWKAKAETLEQELAAAKAATSEAQRLGELMENAIKKACGSDGSINRLWLLDHAKHYEQYRASLAKPEPLQGMPGLPPKGSIQKISGVPLEKFLKDFQKLTSEKPEKLTGLTLEEAKAAMKATPGRVAILRGSKYRFDNRENKFQAFFAYNPNPSDCWTSNTDLNDEWHGHMSCAGWSLDPLPEPKAEPAATVPPYIALRDAFMSGVKTVEISCKLVGMTFGIGNPVTVIFDNGCETQFHSNTMVRPVERVGK